MPGLVGIQLTIFERLTALGLPAIEQDARDIHRRVRELPHVRDVKRAILALRDYEVKNHFHAVRRARIQAFEEQVDTMPPCPHGFPGGDAKHPRTGDVKCELCRRGVVLVPPHPEQVEADDQLTGLVVIWAQAHAGPVGFVRLERARTELRELAGLPETRPEWLTEIARGAGAARLFPLQYLTSDNTFTQGSDK